MSTPQWTTGTTYRISDLCFNGDNVYQSNSDGVSGGTPPTHEFGTATDGTVSWDWVRKYDEWQDLLTNTERQMVINFDNWVRQQLSIPLISFGSVDNNYQQTLLGILNKLGDGTNVPNTTDSTLIQNSGPMTRLQLQSAYNWIKNHVQTAENNAAIVDAIIGMQSVTR